MKTSELSGVMLDCWVAIAEGASIHHDDWRVLDFPMGIRVTVIPGTMNSYSPSTNWAQGMPLIERMYDVRIYKNSDGCTVETFKGRVGGFVPVYGYGETILIAGMRALVASVYGEEVPDQPSST